MKILFLQCKYGDYENPILQYMYVHDNTHNNHINYKT